MDCVWLADVAVSSPSVAGAECSGICLLLCLCYCQTSLLLFAVIPESCSRESVVCRCCFLTTFQDDGNYQLPNR